MINKIKYLLECINEYGTLKNEHVLLNRKYHLLQSLCNRLEEENNVLLDKMAIKEDKLPPSTNIYYSAPNRKLLTSYLKYPEGPLVDTVANNILEHNNCSDLDKVLLYVMRWLHDKFIKKEFSYKLDRGEQWENPELTLKNKYGDCDSWGLVLYYILRKIFSKISKWSECKDRLFCNCGNLNRRGNYPSPLEGHFYLTWKAFKDDEEYTIETTGYRGMASLNYLNVPQRINPLYGVIWFSFSEDKMYRRHWIK